MNPLPSGRQHRLQAGDYTATVATVGAAVREFRYRGRDLFVPFAEDAMAPRFHGALLAPWPNRITNGRYDWDGVTRQLALTEPDRGHALHGLLCWQDFSLAAAAPHQVTLHATTVPQPGYPFAIRIEVVHQLESDGLRTIVTARNTSATRAPVAVGAHPWIAVAAGLDTAVLELPADRYLRVAGPRLLPDGLAEVPAEFDFRSPRALGSTRIDHAFTGLARDRAGASTIAVVGTDGWGARLTIAADIPWVQVCTSDWPDADHRRAIAIEPMSAPPDAFATGVDVADLAPGASRNWDWRYSAISRDA